MFILREISADGGEYNRILGEDFAYINRFEFPKSFDRWIESKKARGENEEAEFFDSRCFGFISYNHGAAVIHLMGERDYYLMCSDGSTFKHLKVDRHRIDNRQDLSGGGAEQQ